jgi:hypothetical protein
MLPRSLISLSRYGPNHLVLLMYRCGCALVGMLSRGRRGHHRIIRLLCGRIKELPAPFALCQTGQHYQRRELVRRRFFS